jgi:hypothetical protein
MLIQLKKYRTCKSGRRRNRCSIFKLLIQEVHSFRLKGVFAMKKMFLMFSLVIATSASVMMPVKNAGAWWDDDDYWDRPWYGGGPWYGGYGGPYGGYGYPYGGYGYRYPYSGGYYGYPYDPYYGGYGYGYGGGYQNPYGAADTMTPQQAPAEQGGSTTAPDATYPEYPAFPAY